MSKIVQPGATLLACLLCLASGAQADTVVEEWLRTHAFPPYTYGAMVALDGAGNVISVGYDPGASDLITIKYDPAGNPLWERHYAMPGFCIVATWVATDAGSNVVVTGYPRTFSSNPVGIGLLTVKYDSGGSLLWDDLYEGTRGTATRALIDATGNIFVAGKIWSGSDDFVTIKYAPDGTRVWQDVFDQAGGFHAPTAMDLDADGNLLVTGGGVASGVITVMYDANGTRRWVSAHAGTGGQSVEWTDDGHFYLTGSWYTQATGNDVRLLKYDANGALIWERFYDFGGSESGTRLAIDTQGNVCITGFESAGYANWLTLKTDGHGNLLWSQVQDSHNANDEFPGFMVTGPEDEVYVTGTGGPPPIPFTSYVQTVTLRYNSDGTTAWTQRHYEWASRGVGAVLGNDRSLYVVGLGNSITTIRYGQPTEVSVPDGSGEPLLTLEQNYPNPFRFSTRLNFAIPQAEHVRLTVYDLSGRLVRLLADEEMAPGQHGLDWDGTDEDRRPVPNGVYFCRLQRPGREEHRRMTLLR